MHHSISVLENYTHKLLWAFDIHTDPLISTRRPELIIINNNNNNNNNNNKKGVFPKFADFAVPADHR